MMMIGTPLPESQFDLNFAIFNGQIENMCRDSLNNSKYEVRCKGEGSSILFSIIIREDEDIYDHDRIDFKEPNAIDI